MLYVTTRNSRDAFTAQRALRENRGPDGGLYLPFRAPVLSPEDMDGLLALPFNRCVAEVLNLLFRTRLTAWDVDFSVGRYPVRLEALRNRIILAEAWHNPDWSFETLARNLVSYLRGEEIRKAGSWAGIAVRIAVLFGVFGELKRSGCDGNVDICAVSGDFSTPISAWYARQWGLPIGSIVCCCGENNGLWDLICHGQLRTDAVSVPTAVPEADAALPEELERLVYGCGGTAEVERYLDACRTGGIYCPGDPVLSAMRRGLYVSVVSSQRVERTIPNAWRTHGCLMSPGTALAYAGLLDYRAKTGRTGTCLFFSESGPLSSAETVAGLLGIPVEELKNRM